MHICYLITRAEMGGSQTHVLDLIKGFREKHQVTLVTGEAGFLTEQTECLGVATHILPNLVQPLRPFEDLKALRDLTGLLRRIKPDLVHCHTSKAGVLGRVAARVAGIPAVFTAHTWSFAEGTSRLWKMIGTPSERLAASWTNKVIAVSHSNRALAVDAGVVPPHKIVTIHNGIADTPFRARPDRAGVPRITMVARFAPQKNQAELLQAMAEIDAPFRLTFVGDGPTRRETEALCEKLNLQSRVEFLGVRADTDRILADSDLFVLATKWEGFPITILEAMRAGLPVIASDVDGVREAVVDGVTGFLVARNDALTLRNRILFLLRSNSSRQLMGSAGRNRYESEFTVATMLHRIEDIYAHSIPAFAETEPALQSV